MDDVDIKSLFFLFAIGNLFITVILSVYIKYQDKKMPYLNIFILSRLLFFFQWLLYYLRGSLPLGFAVGTANTMFVFGIFYEVYCILFAKAELNKKSFIKLHIIPLIFSLLFLLFLYKLEFIRNTIITLLITIFYATGFVYMLLLRNKSIVQKLASYFYFLVLAMFIIRTIWVFFIDRNLSLYTQSDIQVISYISLILVSLFWTVILLLLLKEKNEEKIIRDNIKLLELNKIKDKFFSIIAHDLRGPLASLYQIGELLWIDRGQIKEDDRDALTKSIYESAKSTFNLLDNLLKWAASSSGTMSFTPSNIMINKIVNENVEIFQQKAQIKNIDLSTQINVDMEVYADYNMIMTVVRNIISNAIKFTPRGGKIQVVYIENTDNISIAVVDNGVGMSPEEAVTILEIDSSYSSPGTENESGSGLGLKLCKEFVIKNKGSIWIESELNVGTKIWVSLPRARI